MKKKMMKKMTKKNEKMDILSKKLSKNCNLDDGEIFADISDETMTITLYVCTVTIKSFSSVPI